MLIFACVAHKQYTVDSVMSCLSTTLLFTMSVFLLFICLFYMQLYFV